MTTTNKDNLWKANRIRKARMGTNVGFHPCFVFVIHFSLHRFRQPHSRLIAGVMPQVVTDRHRPVLLPSRWSV